MVRRRTQPPVLLLFPLQYETQLQILYIHTRLLERERERGSLVDAAAGFLSSVPALPRLVANRPSRGGVACSVPTTEIKQLRVQSRSRNVENVLKRRTGLATQLDSTRLPRMPHPNQQDRLCDIIGDILSLNSSPTDCPKRKQTMKKDQAQDPTPTRLMTFPQIWVESVCDDSTDDDDVYTDEDNDKNRRRRRHIDDVAMSTRCMSFSSTDVSFESASTSSLSPASTRQNSLQFASRDQYHSNPFSTKLTKGPMVH